MAIDRDELELVRASLRHVIDTVPPAQVTAALVEAGWNDLTRSDPGAAITVLGEQAGAARSAAPVTDLAMLWGAGIDADATTATVVEGLALAGADQADRFVVVTADAVTLVNATSVELEAAGGLDPGVGLRRARVTTAGAHHIGDAALAGRSIAAGRRALASQMVGASDQMLAETLRYVVDRTQYQRPIGSFQTVKHRLADVKVAITAARAAVRAAWEYADTSDAEVAAIAAKCLAGRAHHLASTHCFQVHGGIAFTAEHGFQQWVRRGLLLDHLLGGHEQLTVELGRRLIASSAVPRLPDLY